MTNTITLDTDTHGAFKVDSDHLTRTMIVFKDRDHDYLLTAATNLLGLPIADYSDLTRLELMILISYLTGGSRD